MGLSLLATTDTQIIRVVEALYNQRPGYTFLSNFKTYVTENSIDALANSLAGNFATSSDAELAATVTANLGLTGEALAAGNAYLEAQFASSPAARGKVILDAMNTLATMESDPVFGAVAATFNADTVASLSYSTNASNTEVTTSDAAADLIAGQTYTLTTGTDVRVGSAGDDSFSASLVGAAGAGTTLQPGDDMNGGDGADTLNLTITGDDGGGYTVAGVKTTSIEKVSISNFDTDNTAYGTAVDAALLSGVETISLYASGDNGDTAISNLGNIVNAEMRNGSADLKLTYTSATVSGSADAQNLTVSNITAGTFNVAGVETVNVTSEIVESTLAALTASKLTTLSVAGDKDLTITAALDFDGTASGTVITGTIDASTFTGDLTAKVGADAENLSVTTGAGDDTVDFQGTLTKNDVVDLGTGSNTVVISVADTGNGSAATQNFTDFQLTNVSTMKVGILDTSGGTTVDAKALDDATVVSVVAGTTDTDVTVNNVGATQEVTVINNAAGTLELGDVAVNLEDDTSSSDSMTVNLYAASDADQTLDLLTIDDGAEAASINVNGLNTTAGSDLTLTSLIADNAATITLGGAGNLVVTLDETGTNKTATIDASAMTGEFKFTEAVTNDLTITGSATAKNTFVMVATLDNDDTLAGGSSTTDSVSATAGSALTATTGVLNLSAIETLALTATDAQTAVVDLTNASDVTTVSVAASSTGGNANLTLKGLAAGVTVETTDQATNDFEGTLTLALADATGSEDAITLSLENDSTDDAFTLVTSGIETLNIASVAAVNEHSIDVSGSDAAKIVLTGGEADKSLTLSANKLNKAVTEVDASAFSGDVVTDASATDSVGVNFKMGDLTITTTTGDTVVGSASTTSDDTLSGNFAASDASAEFTQLSGIEHYELTIADAVDIVAASSDGLGDGDNVVETIKLSGGNALASYTAADAIDGTSLTSFDASAFNGTTTINVSAAIAQDVTLKAGSATDDALSFSGVNGLLKASTGILTADGFENVALLTATAASTIDATGLTGVDAIAVENDQNVTLDGLAAGVDVQLGAVASNNGLSDYSGLLEVKLADETGSDDALTVNLVKTYADDLLDATLKTTGIETVTIKHNAVASKSDGDLNISAVKAANLILTGGLAGESLDLTKGSSTLSSTTTSVDATGLASDLTLAAAGSTATTVTAKAQNISFTGSAAADSLTVGSAGSEIGAAITLFDGGSGSDTLTAYVEGSASLINIEAVETINLIATTGTMSIVGAASSKGINDASTVNISGGEAGKVVTLSGAITDHAVAIDASGLAGSVAMTFGAAGLLQTNIADAITITGGQSTKDLVTASYGANAVENSGQFTMSGVETLTVTTTAASSGGVDVVDLINVTGLDTLNLVTTTTNANGVTVSNLSTSTTVALGTSASTTEFAGVTAKLDLADATGTSDALTVNLVDTHAGGATATIQTDGIEALTLALANTAEDHLVVLSNTNADNNATLTVTGTHTSADLTITTLADVFTTVDASGLGGKFVMSDSSRSLTDAMTITTALKDDTIIMQHGNDVLTAGEKTGDNDTLKVVANFILGGIAVDLSATDQIVTYNGSANAASQTEFESVDLSGVTGSFGADITAVSTGSTITGTANADVIAGGAGDDTITGGNGNDTMTGGAGADDFVFSVLASNGVDTISSFVTTSDDLNVVGIATLAGTAAVDTATATTDVIGLAAGKVIIVTDDTNSSYANVLTIMNAALDTSGDVSGSTVIAVNNGTDSRLYAYVDDANAADVEVAEITHFATITGVADLAIADLIGA
jgi:trimeric autotransporter adhesin